jgi:hypothetical protein
LIHNRNDPIVPEEHGRALAAAIDGAAGDRYAERHVGASDSGSTVSGPTHAPVAHRVRTVDLAGTPVAG